MKKLYAVFILGVFLIFSGCERSFDINERVIVQGIGIDFVGEDTVQLTVQTLNTDSYSGIGGAKVPEKLVKNYILRGKNVADALSKLSTVSGKQALFTHTRIILIGKSQAQSGINDVIDFFSRHSSCHAGLYIAVCDGNASDVLQAENESETVPAVEIENAVKASQFGGETADVHIYELIKMYREKTTNAFLPIVSLVKNGNKKIADVSKTAVFTLDKMTGEIGRDDTLLLMLFMNRITSATYTSDKTENGISSFDFYKSRCTTKAHVDNGRVVYEVKIKCALDLVEYTGKSTLDTNMQKKMETELETEFTKRMQTFLYKMSRSQYDCMRLGRILLINDKNAYRIYESQWPKVLENADFNISVNVNLRRTGQEITI